MAEDREGTLMTHRDSCPAGPLGPLGGECNCRTIPRVDENGWHYLLMFPDHTVVQCAGDWDVASKHLRAIRAEPRWQKGGPFPVLIGAYPPNSVGGPEGRGGVRSFGYRPNLIGNIDIDPSEWINA